MSDFSQTVSCDRLPQRIAARIERSPLISSINAASAAVNRCSTAPGFMRKVYLERHSVIRYLYDILSI